MQSRRGEREEGGANSWGYGKKGAAAAKAVLEAWLETEIAAETKRTIESALRKIVQ